MTAQAHAEAVKALLGETVRVYDGKAPADAVLPYALLLMDDGTAARTTLAPLSDRREHEFQINSVGADMNGVRSVADRVRTALVDKRPAVAGRATNPIKQEFAQPVQVDRDVTPHRLVSPAGYSFTSVPAPA